MAYNPIANRNTARLIKCVRLVNVNATRKHISPFRISPDSDFEAIVHNVNGISRIAFLWVPTTFLASGFGLSLIYMLVISILLFIGVTKMVNDMIKLFEITHNFLLKGLMST